MQTLRQDVRFAFRSFARNPLFALAAVLSISLGIGVNTAIFSFADELFFRQLPVQEPDRLVSVYGTDERSAGESIRFFPISYPNYLDYREENGSLSGLAAYTWIRLGLADGDQPEQVLGQIVTGNYFEILGVKAAKGRTLSTEDDRIPGAHPVVVLSYGFWQRRFGSDSEIIGKTVFLNTFPFTVVGVAEEGFKGPYVTHSFELWVPMMMHEQVLDPEGSLNSRDVAMVNLIGRLKPGVSWQEAAAEMETLAVHLAREYPSDNKGVGVRLLPLEESAIHPNRRDLFVRSGVFLMSVVGLVLLIACANVGNLLLARAVARRKEIAIRQSIGASHRRLFRQFVTESTLLSLIGAAAGLAVAAWGRRLLWSLRPPFFTEHSLDLSLNGRILGFTLLLSLLVGVVFGVISALQAARSDVVWALSKYGTPIVSGNRWFRLRSVFLASQIALSVVALVGAGLFLKSLRNIERQDPGFERHNLATISFDLAAQGYDEATGRDFYDRVLAKARGLAEVEEAALARSRPLDPPVYLRTVLLEGQQEDSDEGVFLLSNIVSRGYFETLGIPRLHGRDFSEWDHQRSRKVAIVNETMAERLWPQEQAVGKRFRFADGDGELLEVVGVYRDSKYNSLDEAPQPYVYLPLSQDYSSAITLHVRTTIDPAGVLDVVRREVQTVDENLPLLKVSTITEIIDSSLRTSRIAAVLLTLFGLLALILSAIGTYGVVSFVVNRRRYDIGVRMAFGAERASILWMTLRSSFIVATVGVMVGLAVAYAMTRVVSNLLYGVSTTDAMTFIGSSILLLIIALLASLEPAWRATRVNPVDIIRSI